MDQIELTNQAAKLTKQASEINGARYANQAKAPLVKLRQLLNKWTGLKAGGALESSESSRS